MVDVTQRLIKTEIRRYVIRGLRDKTRYLASAARHRLQRHPLQLPQLLLLPPRLLLHLQSVRVNTFSNLPVLAHTGYW